MSQLNPQKMINEKVLEVCEFTKCQQVNVDLTVSENVILNNLQSLNVLLNKIVHLPKDVYATFTHRSSYNRKGVLITGSIYDPGYNGQIGYTIYNMSKEELRIGKNKRIGQIMFFKADPASSYSGQYQGEHL